MTTKQQQQQQAHLDALLGTLATDAGAIILSIRDELYPVAYDPSTGVLVEAEVN